MAAAPAAAAARKTAAKKTAAKKTAAAPGAAAGGAPKKTAPGGAPKKTAPAGGKKTAQQGGTTARSGAGTLLRGDTGRYRRMMIAEFIVCAVLLGLSPLAKGRGEMGPVRFMKRGSATCALFVVLGLVSSAGRGAARAAAMFGALVPLVLLVDPREAVGRLATVLTVSEADEEKDQAFLAEAGPDPSTDADDGAGVIEA